MKTFVFTNDKDIKYIEANNLSHAWNLLYLEIGEPSSIYWYNIEAED